MGQTQNISFRVSCQRWKIAPHHIFFNPATKPFICPAYCLCPFSSISTLSVLYLSAIRQIVAGLICIMSVAFPTGTPRGCLLKDSGATALSRSPIPWIKLTLGQHQHIMNYGHLPLQTHCFLCSSVRNIESTSELGLLTAYSLPYLLCSAPVRSGCRAAMRCEAVNHPVGKG